MVWWPGGVRGAVLVGSVLLAFAACGGKRQESRGLDTQTGAGGFAGQECREPNGSAACNTCHCGVCTAKGCLDDAGRSGSGSGSDGGAAGATNGCDVGGVQHTEGSSWSSECNTCYCLDAEVVCTLRDCSASGGMSSGGTTGSAGGGMSSGGTTGSAGGGGLAASAGVGNGGVGMSGSSGADTGTAGEAGAPSQCVEAKVSSFCIVGTPSDDDRFDLTVGMPLEISVQTDGCYGATCGTEVVSVDCKNGIGSTMDWYVSPFICVAPQECSGNCGPWPEVSCQPGQTLEEGEYRIGIGGSPLSVTFQVPGHLREADLCSQQVVP